MIKIALFTGGDLTYFTKDFDCYVGVDRGSLFLLENGLSLDIAIGDFDSVSKVELAKIKAATTDLNTAPAEKNDTDTELALKIIFQKFPEAEVTIFGAFGGRLDHLMSNIFLPSDPDLAPFMRQIILRDAQNIVQFLPAGQHILQPQSDMTYISFMTEETDSLSIEGAKYDLNESNFFKKKMYSSNEFINQPIKVSLDHGYLIVIYSKDRS